MAYPHRRKLITVIALFLCMNIAHSPITINKSSYGLSTFRTTYLSYAKREALRVPLDSSAHDRMDELYNWHEGTKGNVDEKAKAIDVFIKRNIKNKKAENLLVQTTQHGFPKIIAASLAKLSSGVNRKNMLQKLQNLFAQTKGGLWGIGVENIEDLPYHPDKEERKRGTLVWGHSGNQSISYFYLPEDTMIKKARRIYHEIVDRSTKLEDMIRKKFDADSKDVFTPAQVDEVLTEYEVFVKSIENTLKLENDEIVFSDKALEKEFASLTFKSTMFDVRHFTMAERKFNRRHFLKIVGKGLGISLVYFTFPFLFTGCSRTITEDDQNFVEALIVKFEETYKAFVEEQWDQDKKDAVNYEANELLNLKGTKKTYLGIKVVDTILNQGQALSELDTIGNKPLYHLLVLSRFPIEVGERLNFLTHIYDIIEEGYKNIKWPDNQDDKTAKKIQFSQGIIKNTLVTIATTSSRSISQPRTLSESLANAAILFIGDNHLPAIESIVVTYLRDPNFDPFFKAPFIDYFVKPTLWHMKIGEIPNHGFDDIMSALKDLFEDSDYRVRSNAEDTYNRYFISGMAEGGMLIPLFVKESADLVKNGHIILHRSL